MAVLQDVNINVYAQPSEKRVRTFLALSQNENGRRICFRILGAPLPSNCSATFSGTKPDGTVYTTTGTVTGNFVIVQEDVQMTAVPGVWDANLDVVNETHNIVTAIIRVMVERGAVAPGSVPSNSQLDGYVAQCKSYAEQARTEAYGSPLTAATKSAMTDKTRVYVYTGSEANMTAGNWYYWNGSAWTSGGVYNAVAVQTDKTLTVQDKAADGKATGDALNALKAEISDVEENQIPELKSELSKVSSGSAVDIISSASIVGTVLVDGTNNGASQYVRSDYIPVFKGYLIECIAMQLPNTAAIISTYNTAKSFISSVAGLGSTTNAYARVKIAQDGYIRISTKAATISDAHCYLYSVSAQNAVGISDLQQSMIKTKLYTVEPKTYKDSGMILCTFETMPPKHTCYYSITSTPKASYILLCDVNNNTLATLGSSSSTVSGRTDSGKFVVPDNFAYAKVMTSNADAALTVNYMYTDLSIPKEIEALNAPRTILTEITRVKRFIDRYYHNQTTRALGNQSMTYHKNLCWTCGNIDSDNDNQTVCAWNFGTSALVACSRFTALGHANDIAGLGDQLVVVCGDLNIAVLDIANDNTVTLNRKINMSSVFTQSVYAIASFSNTIYVLGHHLTDNNKLSIATVDLSTDSATVVASFAKFSSVKPQGMEVYANVAYLLYNRSNVIYTIDLRDNRILSNYNLPAGDDNIAVGEYETPLVINGHMYVYSALYYNYSAPNVDSEVAIGQLFRTNIMSQFQERGVYDYMEGLTPIVITVDGSMALTSNPIQKVSTVEEGCGIVNSHHGGSISIADSSDGIAAFFDGKYSIVSSDGTNEVTAIIAYNSDVIISGVDASILYAVNSRIITIGSAIAEIESINSVVSEST